MKSRADSFVFRRFTLDQQGASHRLGIDAVALGCWVNLKNARSILDCGTGTGILALLAAQRSEAQVDAIDINPSNVACAVRNFQASEFSDRLQVRQADWMTFEPVLTPDHILCNPPYFKAGVQASDVFRNRARQEDDHGIEGLFRQAAGWVSPGGQFSLIFPQSRRAELMNQALANGWFRLKEARITEGKSGTDRFMVTLGRQQKLGVEIEEIPVWSDEGNYHHRFRNLTSEAYVNL